MKDQANDKRSPIIAGALILTAAFLIVFGWLLSRTNTCAEGWWLWDRLACLEPNALGDTFAGAFAPVAFVWLVAAVMLQRNELAAQRQELREARTVAEAQVVEARNNVAHMAKQTEILALRAEFDAAEANDDKFAAALTALLSTIERVTKHINVWSEADFGNGMNQEYSAFYVAPRDDHDEMRRLNQYFDDLRTSSVRIYRDIESGMKIEYDQVDLLDVLVAEISEVIEGSKSTSLGVKKRFANVLPEETRQALVGLRSHVVNHGKWRDPSDF